MKNLSNYSSHNKTHYPSEINELGIVDRYRQPKLPRHMCVPETTYNNRQRNHFSSVDLAPKICKLNPVSTTPTNLALDILKYQLGDRLSQQKHLENLHSNLEHRLAVAKAQGNLDLVRVLQNEYKQLAASL